MKRHSTFKSSPKPLKRGRLRKKGKAKVKKPKAHNASWWKKRADTLMSLYVRLHYADSEGMVHCYTCPKILHWKEIQNGHFVSRQHNSTRYWVENCRPQCIGCNVFGRGKVTKFANNLEKENPGIVAELYRKAAEITPMRTADYQIIGKGFEVLLQALKGII